MQGGLAVKSDNFNVAAPGADTDILATALTPTHGGYFQIFVVLATTSVFNMTVSDGTTTFTVGLNNSVALDSGDGFVFPIPVSTAYSYNFQVETDGIIRILQVNEITDPIGGGGAQGFQA